MGPASAQLLDELGYDPDDGVPSIEPGAPGDPGDPGGLGSLGVPLGTVRAVRIGARRVAVARLGSGRLVIVEDECPHDGGRISDGFVDGEQLVCARHGWQLEVRNGRCQRACKLRE
jgi:nitrite reductase/ring-hydroxylating ferredoxin subunit